MGDEVMHDYHVLQHERPRFEGHKSSPSLRRAFVRPLVGLVIWEHLGRLATHSAGIAHYQHTAVVGTERGKLFDRGASLRFNSVKCVQLGWQVP